MGIEMNRPQSELLEKLERQETGCLSTNANPRAKHRIIKTVCLFSNSVGIGMVAAVAGTTLIQTRLLYDVTTATMSVALTLESVGCLVGVVVCSWLIGRVKFEFIAGCCVTLSALMTIGAPFVYRFPVFAAAVTIRGFAAGIFLLNSQTFNVDSWEGHRYKAMITQAQNAVWSVGAFLSPFIMQPFLVELVPLSSSIMNDVSVTLLAFKDQFTELYDHLHNVTSAASVTAQYVSADNDAMFHTTAISGYAPIPEGPPISIVRFAYVIVGLLSLALTLPNFAMYFYANGAILPCMRRKEHSDSKLTELDVNGSHGTPFPTTSKRPSCSAVTYAIIVFCIGMLYGGLELTPRSFLTTFVVSRLSWTVRDATLLLSVFYAAFGSGRILAVPLSLVISPAATLTVNIIIIGAGYTILLMIDFFVHLNPIFVWIGSALIGFGLSSSFACLVLVVPTARSKMDGLPLSITLSALSIGCIVGAILFPVLVGNLFDQQSPMWMVYVSIFATVIEAVLLVVRYAIGRLHFRKY